VSPATKLGDSGTGEPDGVEVSRILSDEKYAKIKTFIFR
jgi:hypothetical protein